MKQGMRMVLTMLCCVMMALFGVGCAKKSRMTPVTDQKTVLFIGNSYTAANNLPKIVADLSRQLGYQIKYDAVTPGGATFFDHARNPVVEDKIFSQDWDYVVLQNQSQTPGWKPKEVLEKSVPHAKTLVKMIKESSPSAEVLYFGTWGRRDGDTQNCGYYPKVCDFVGHTEALTEGYRLYTAHIGGTVVPVGSVWQQVVEDPRRPFPSDQLWTADGSHPSLLGSYLTGLVFVDHIFSESVIGLDSPTGINPTYAEYLQEVVEGL